MSQSTFRRSRGRARGTGPGDSRRIRHGEQPGRTGSPERGTPVVPFIHEPRDARTQPSRAHHLGQSASDPNPTPPAHLVDGERHPHLVTSTSDPVTRYPRDQPGGYTPQQHLREYAMSMVVHLPANFADDQEYKKFFSGGCVLAMPRDIRTIHCIDMARECLYQILCPNIPIGDLMWQLAPDGYVFMVLATAPTHDLVLDPAADLQPVLLQTRIFDYLDTSIEIGGGTMDSVRLIVDTEENIAERRKQRQTLAWSYGQLWPGIAD